MTYNQEGFSDTGDESNSLGKQLYRMTVIYGLHDQKLVMDKFTKMGKA